MSQTLIQLSNYSLDFPAVHQALEEPNGLLAIGGDLTPERLINAYRSGIFPWFSELDPILWWSPDPRTVLFANDVYINRSLKKFIRKLPYQISLNKAFDQVISLCADAPFRREGTWILPEMIDAYKKLHQLGYAQSIEVWNEQELVGGLYGIAINGLFCGESMFYRQTNASKIALIALSQLMASQGINYIDCQLMNPFLKDMGAKEVSRQEFVTLKDKAQAIALPNSFWQSRGIQLTDV